MYIMMKDGLSLALFWNSERITHCFFSSGGRIFMCIFVSIGWISSFKRSTHPKAKHEVLPEPVWVVKLFVLLLMMLDIQDRK